HLQIHFGARPPVPEVRDLSRVRNQYHAQRRPGDVVDGERDTVERHGALLRHEASLLFAKADAHQPGFALFLYARNLGDAVDVAAQHVTTQAIAYPQRTFEIHVTAERQA